MDKKDLQKFAEVSPLPVRPYEQYMPPEDNANYVEKLNQVIQSLALIGRLNNDTVKMWNSVMEWITTDTLENIVADVTNEKLDVSLNNGLKELTVAVADGKINELLQSGQFESIVETAITTIHSEVTDELAGFNVKLAETEEELAQKVKLSKIDHEGQFPSPIRVPVLGIDKMYPNIRDPYVPLWVDGETIYAFTSDLTLRKSINGGRTWEIKGYNNLGFSSARCFLKISENVLIAFSATGRIIRSIDDGMNWTTVLTLRSGTLPLGTQSWGIDKKTGHIYYGEYNSTPQSIINIYRSTDGGVNWDVFYTFSTTGVEGISHVHAVQWDHIAERIVFCTGDGSNWTGLWRVNGNGDGIEKIVTNDMLSSEFRDAPRSIGIMPFKDYIVWASDSTQNPYLFRMARSEIGKENPVIERVYRLNSTSWFTCRASNDGSRWVFTSSEESNSLDNLVHIYAVEDEGETVWEVGSVTGGTNLVNSLMPVGLAENYGEDFYLISRNFGSFIWKFRLGKGFINLPKPELLPLYRVTQTYNTPQMITLAPGEEHVIGVTLANLYARKLFVLEASIFTRDSGGVSPGNQRLLIRRSNGEPLLQYSKESERYFRRVEYGNEIDTLDFSGGQYVEFVVKNVHLGATIKVMASITFAWG